MQEKVPKRLKKEFFDRFAVLITGAFTFVAGLAWNSAIQSLIEKYFSAGKTVLSQITYAIIITIIAILVTHQINEAAIRMEDKEEKK